MPVPHKLKTNLCFIRANEIQFLVSHGPPTQCGNFPNNNVTIKVACSLMSLFPCGTNVLLVNSIANTEHLSTLPSTLVDDSCLPLERKQLQLFLPTTHCITVS